MGYRDSLQIYETYDGHEDEEQVPPMSDHFKVEPLSEVDRK
jgi:hypothetical protein